MVVKKNKVMDICLKSKCPYFPENNDIPYSIDRYGVKHRTELKYICGYDCHEIGPCKNKCKRLHNA